VLRYSNASPGRSSAIAESTIAPPTLITLPSEICQAIISNTITAHCKPREKRKSYYELFYLTTPFHAVCKILEADIKKTLQSWLPNPVTASLVPIKDIRDLEYLNQINTHFIDVAKASNRT
jgi:hypothetical protein